MKKNSMYITILALICAGCVVPTTYTKSISVKKDADGKVIETTETEGVVQAGQGYPIQFQHLDSIQLTGGTNKVTAPMRR